MAVAEWFLNVVGCSSCVWSHDQLCNQGTTYHDMDNPQNGMQLLCALFCLSTLGNSNRILAVTFGKNKYACSVCQEMMFVYEHILCI